MSSTRSLQAGGPLVLGQEGAQGSKKLAFSGDLYNLNLFNKRLSGDEVAAMFTAGRCGMVDMALTDSLVVTCRLISWPPRAGAGSVWSRAPVVSGSYLGGSSGTSCSNTSLNIILVNSF